MKAYDPEVLRRLQLAELDLLCETDRICREYGIEYSLEGGTLLGAIRHKGFIPWDDDVDVAMLRSDYDRFFDACKKSLNKEKYFLQDYRTDPAYPWGYAKLRMRHTLFLREGQEHLKFHQGIGIDLIIFDNVPDGVFTRRIFTFLCFFLRKCQYAVVGKTEAPNAFLRAVYRLLDLIPKRFVFHSIERMAAVTNKKRTRLIRPMTWPCPKRCPYGMPRRCFDSYTDAEFEGHRFRIFKRYHLYLKTIFGDYMQLPPESERKVHPASKIVLPPAES